MRLNLPASTVFSSRDGTTDKDSHAKNAYAEMRGEDGAMRQRPGVADLGEIGTGAAQLLVHWNALLSVIGDSLASLVLTSYSATTYPVNNVTKFANRWLGFATQSGSPDTLHLYQFTDTGSASSLSSYSGFTHNATGTADGPSAVCVAGIDTSTGYGKIVKVTSAAPTTLALADTVSSAASWGQVRYINGLFVAVFVLGDDITPSTKIRYSADGVTWTNVDYTGANLYDVIHDGTKYVFVGYVNTYEAVVVTSTNLSSFTLTNISAQVDVEEYFDRIAFVGVAYYALARDSGVYSGNYTSADAATWTLDSTVSNYFESGGYQFREDSSGISVYDSGWIAPWSSVANISAGYNGTDWVLIWGPVAGPTTAYTLSFATASGSATESTISALSPLSASEFIYAESNGEAQSTQQLLLKNSQQAWVYTVAGGLALVTDVDYPGVHTVSVSSITRSGTTATVTTSAAHPFATGDSVLIAGAAQADYNGTKTVTVTDSTHFTYTVSGSPATPATGTITARGGAKRTVPGIVYLDGYFFVMDEQARIQNSAIGNGTSWSALDFLTAEKEPGGGVAIAKTQSYIVAFKEWSTEYFYDAANATGSPLSPVDNGFRLVGCASGQSVASFDETLFWVSQTKQKGRAVHMAQGLEQAVISTPDIERVLNADDLATVHAYGLRIGGHRFYLLTLVTSNITLVYDIATQTWAIWSSLTLNGSSVSVSSITCADGVATVTASGHGFSDGDPVKISGATQDAYNGIQQIQYIDANTFRFAVAGSPATPATGTITATGYTESCFKFTKYCYSGGRDLVLHATDGHLYEITEDAYRDAGLPIDVILRTGKLDGGGSALKTLGSVDVIGNKSDSTAMMRWTDDDYQTYSAYRPIDLSADRATLRRCGAFRRRAFELRHNSNAAIQLAALEM